MQSILTGCRIGHIFIAGHLPSSNNRMNDDDEDDFFFFNHFGEKNQVLSDFKALPEVLE